MNDYNLKGGFQVIKFLQTIITIAGFIVPLAAFLKLKEEQESRRKAGSYCLDG